MADEAILKKLTLSLLLLILIVLSLLVLWPLSTAIILGLLLAYVFYPLYKRLYKSIGKKSLAGLIVILIVLIVIFVPLWFLFPLLINQIFNSYLFLQKVNLIDSLNKIFPSLFNINISKDLAVSLNSFIVDFAKNILASASSIVLDLPNLLLKCLVVFFVFFFAMTDADELKKYVASISPFSASTEKDLSKQFESITYSVIYGQVIVGVVQGLVTGLGLLIFSVPNALTLTIVATFVGVLPIIGPWFVWIPVSAYLLVAGRTGAGIGLALYGLIIVSWIDVLIRPLIVARKIKTSSAVVLIGMIGGLIVFGVLGLILGPLILSYLLLALDAYRNKSFPNLFLPNTK